jgi:hypothetical protein
MKASVRKIKGALYIPYEHFCRGYLARGLFLEEGFHRFCDRNYYMTKSGKFFLLGTDNPYLLSIDCHGVFYTEFTPVSEWEVRLSIFDM